MQWISGELLAEYRVESHRKCFVSSAISGVVMATLRNVVSDPVWARYSFAS